MNKKVYKVYFNITINCNGIWRMVQSSLSVPAESEEEARKIFKENVSMQSSISKVETISFN